MMNTLLYYIYDYVFFLSSIYILFLKAFSLRDRVTTKSDVPVYNFQKTFFGYMYVAAVCNSSSWKTLHRDVSHLFFFFKSSLRHVVPAIVEILQLSLDFLGYVITVICTIHYVFANCVKPL